MTTLTVFKSTVPSITFIFANGKPAHFVQGTYRTAVDWEISALTAEVTQGHPHLFIDAAEKTIESDMIDPMNALRAKIIADYLEEQARALNPSNNPGDSEQGSVKPASTRDIADAAMGGSGVQVTSKLATLMASTGHRA